MLKVESGDSGGAYIFGFLIPECSAHWGSLPVTTCQFVMMLPFKIRQKNPTLLMLPKKLRLRPANYNFLPLDFSVHSYCLNFQLFKMFKWLT